MKKSIPVLMAVWLLWGAGPPEAQRVYRIGALIGNDQFIPSVEGFKKRMAELGYQEGKNINYDIYNARGERDLIRQMAQKLVRDKPDLIVTASTTATTPVAKLTEGSGIPVVFLSAGNPLVFVKSYSSSGNNLTGISSSEIDLTEKRMELLKELAPGIKKVISLNNPRSENYKANLKATREAAKKLGLKLMEINVTSPEEVIKQSKGLLTRKLGDGIIYPPDAIISAAIREITPEINKEKLPSVAVNIGSVKAGALVTYAADFFALGQRGAALVDKILKGTKPSDLPIEQPYQLKLVVNLKTAKTIGLKIPKEILLRADEVIE
jgi:putative ABC transport system substrate-binding protein